MTESSNAFADQADPPLNRFEDLILTYERQDGLNPPTPGATIFVGSSTFANWHTLEQDLRAVKAINRGFGGSTIPEINYYARRIIVKYRPAKIVFYAGANDIVEGHSGEQVFLDFLKFVKQIHEALPEAEIYWVSMSIAPSRIQFVDQYDQGNQLVRQFTGLCRKFTAAPPLVHYIDVAPVMRDVDGRLKAEYFLEDMLHMNRLGYEAWIPVILSALLANGGSATRFRTGDNQPGLAPKKRGTRRKDHKIRQENQTSN